MTLSSRLWDTVVPSNGHPGSEQYDIWVPSGSIPQTGDRLLVGLARWSDYDRRLLAFLETLPDTSIQIDLIDADQCKSQDAIQSFVPGIGFVHHTPIVGYWQDGVLVESASGYMGRHLLFRVLGVDPTEFDSSETLLTAIA